MTLSLKVTIAKVTKGSRKNAFEDLKAQFISDYDTLVDAKATHYYKIFEDSYEIRGKFNEDKAASDERESQCRELIKDFRN